MPIDYEKVEDWRYTAKEEVILLDKNGEEVDTLYINSLMEEWSRKNSEQLGVDWRHDGSGEVEVYDENGEKVNTVYLDSLVSSWLKRNTS